MPHRKSARVFSFVVIWPYVQRHVFWTFLACSRFRFFLRFRTTRLDLPKRRDSELTTTTTTTFRCGSRFFGVLREYTKRVSMDIMLYHPKNSRTVENDPCESNDRTSRLERPARKDRADWTGEVFLTRAPTACRLFRGSDAETNVPEAPLRIRIEPACGLAVIPLKPGP